MKSLVKVVVAVVVIINLISFFAPQGKAAMADASDNLKYNTIEVHLK